MGFNFFELSRFFGRKVALYRFQRGTLVLRFNSSDRDLTIGGELYLAARGISHTSIRESMSSERKNQVTINVAYLLDAAATDFPVTQALGNWWRPFPPSQRVLVTISATHLGDPDEEVVVEWMGRVVGPTYKPTQLSLTCDPSFRSGRMSGSIPRMQRGCGVALFSQGPGMCNLDPEPLRVNATVSGLVGDVATVELEEEPARSLDARFPMEWVDEDDVPHTANVVSIAANVVTLEDATGLLVGDQVILFTEPLWFDAEVTAVAELTLTAAEFADSDIALAGGLVQWVRGDGLLESRTIMAHSDDEIRIHYGAEDLAPGLMLRTYFGCAHNLEACQELGNAVNYPGFKWLPVEDPMGRSQAW